MESAARIRAGAAAGAAGAAVAWALAFAPLAAAGPDAGEASGADFGAAPPAVLARLPARGPGPAALAFPFAPPPEVRAVAPGAQPAFWADGRSCSTGCRAPGAVLGWPVRPFHRQHALRAGLNERRLANYHIGIDIQARDGTAVYAVQPGVARVLASSGVDARVQVGRFIYWHIVPSVATGQYVVPYRTVVGRVLPTAGHLHLSEIVGGRYLNPLRPGGRILAPWRDTAAPQIAAPQFRAGGVVLVRAFDPQSYRVRTTYVTPVLAPAALAYRVVGPSGRAVTGLRWALRGSQHLLGRPPGRLYTRGARGGGWGCFMGHPICRPNWNYRLAGGLAPPLPRLRSGVYRLIVYAWDWAGNVSARDARFGVG